MPGAVAPAHSVRTYRLWGCRERAVLQTTSAVCVPPRLPSDTRPPCRRIVCGVSGRQHAMFRSKHLLSGLASTNSSDAVTDTSAGDYRTTLDVNKTQSGARTAPDGPPKKSRSGGDPDEAPLLGAASILGLGSQPPVRHLQSLLRPLPPTLSHRFTDPKPSPPTL